MKSIRNIVTIDPDKCNGCGLCIPNCAEGAIRIIDGKAKLVGENLCDGLGACLGHCPMDAITVESRPADPFDESAVHEHLAAERDAAEMLRQVKSASGGCPSGGCPGAAAREVASATGTAASPLRHWPVQLALVPTHGPMWRDAHVLIAADCVSAACPDFHWLLAGKTLAIACPKLDDVGPHETKLATIFTENAVRAVTVAHMEVPCCGGIVRLVERALALAGQSDIELHDVTVGIDGRIAHTISRKETP